LQRSPNSRIRNRARVRSDSAWLFALGVFIRTESSRFGKLCIRQELRSCGKWHTRHVAGSDLDPAGAPSARQERLNGRNARERTHFTVASTVNEISPAKRRNSANTKLKKIVNERSRLFTFRQPETCRVSLFSPESVLQLLTLWSVCNEFTQLQLGRFPSGCQL
jgi:hypothetical protein